MKREYVKKPSTELGEVLEGVRIQTDYLLHKYKHRHIAQDAIQNTLFRSGFKRPVEISDEISQLIDGPITIDQQIKRLFSELDWTQVQHNYYEGHYDPKQQFSFILATCLAMSPPEQRDEMIKVIHEKLGERVKNLLISLSLHMRGAMLYSEFAGDYIPSINDLMDFKSIKPWAFEIRNVGYYDMEYKERQAREIMADIEKYNLLTHQLIFCVL